MDAKRILDAREEKANKVKLYIDKYQVVTLKANIPGNDKNTANAYLLVNLFHDKLINEFKPLFYSFIESDDGPYYMYLFPKEKILKEQFELLESKSLGRFIDIDCFYDSTISKHRSTPRKCYICNDIAFNCIRSRKHTTSELLDYMDREIKGYLYNFVKESLLASALDELNLDTKFGLVSPISNGSHKDMDYRLMKNSLNSIIPYLTEMFIVGYESNNSIDEIFTTVKQIGIKAEEAMFKTTHGVNTYMGLIFNLGLIATSLGIIIKNKEDYKKIFEYSSYMVRNLDTSKGALKEAYNGYPSVNKILEKYSLDDEESIRYALMELILVVEDSIFYKRCPDINEQVKIKSLIKEALKKKDRELINQVNEYCVNKNVSFGGCADLLVVSLFLKRITKLINKC